MPLGRAAYESIECTTKKKESKETGNLWHDSAKTEAALDNYSSIFM